MAGEPPAMIPFAPTDHDIVCSKKKKWFQSHPGNLAYYALLKKYYPAIEEAACRLPPTTPPDYQSLADEILRVVLYERDGRFLKPTDDKESHCHVLSWDDASIKVQLALRKRFSDTKIKQKTLAPTLASLIKNNNNNSTTTQDSPKKKKKPKIQYNDDEYDEKLLEEEEVEDGYAKLPDHSDNDELHQEWIPFRPMPNDVVCGNASKSYRNHPGNAYYRSLLDQCTPKIQNQQTTSRADYDEMIHQIIHSVVRAPRCGRFLRPCEKNNKVCMVLTRKDAADKVLTALRKKRGETKGSGGVVPQQSQSHWTTKLVPKRRWKESSGALQMGAKRATKKAKANDDGDATSTTESSGDRSGDDDDESECTTSPSQASTNQTSMHDNKRDHHNRRTPVVANYSSNHGNNSNNGNDDDFANQTEPTLYGSEQDELDMRRWLNERQLPQLVGNVLVHHGARTIEDVVLLMTFQPSVLQSLACLDFTKLERAVQAEGNVVA